MQSTDNYNLVDEKGLFALFKGESGSGKSAAALSFPEPLVLDHDLKMPAISRKHFPGKKVDYEVFDNLFEVEAILKWMKDFYPYINEESCYADRNNWKQNFDGTNQFPYETVIGDTLTSFSQCILKSVDDQKGQSVYSMIRGARQNSSGKGKTVELRSYDSYNAEDMALKEYIDEMKFLWARPGNPKHVIICAHVLSHDKGGSQVRRIVTAGNKIAVYIPAQFDEMYHFVSQQNMQGPASRLIYTEAMGEDNAKTAYDLPPVFNVSDNQNFYDKISKFVNIGKGDDYVTEKASDYR